MSAEEQHDELEQLLHPLRSPVPLSGPDEVEAQRERLLPALRAHVQRAPLRARRIRSARRVGQVCAAGLAAAACFALGRGLFSPPELPFSKRATVAELESLRVEPLGPSAEVTFIEADGSERELLGPASVRETGEIVAGDDNEARVSTQDGVQVELAPSTRVRVTARQRGRARPPLHLVSGAINCRVPPLGRDDSFSVMTPTAQVIVHGTVFSVRVDGADAKTCVRVERGLVEVRHRDGTTYLGTDSRWGCEPEAKAPVAAKALEPRARPQRASGTLAQEIELLSAALSAEQKQDRERARELFAELLGRYPSSPLVPEARAGLARSRE